MSNLPPGVTPSMVPGSRPDDELEERFYEELDGQLELEDPAKMKIVAELQEGAMTGPALEAYVAIARRLAYEHGFAEGKAEAQIDEALRQDPESHYPRPGPARLSYDDELGHVCTKHGRTMEVDRSIEPTESGAYFYRCSSCGACGWSGA